MGKRNPKKKKKGNKNSTLFFFFFSYGTLVLITATPQPLATDLNFSNIEPYKNQILIQRQSLLLQNFYGEQDCVAKE